MSRAASRQGGRGCGGDEREEEVPLQNPRPPESVRCAPDTVMHRAKRWSAHLRTQCSSVMWGAGEEAPPPVPRHRTESKYNQATSDANHRRLLERRSRAYTCRELLCIVFLPCLLICLLGIACSGLVIYYALDKVSRTRTRTRTVEMQELGKYARMNQGWTRAFCLMSVLFPELPKVEQGALQGAGGTLL